MAKPDSALKQGTADSAPPTIHTRDVIEDSDPDFDDLDDVLDQFSENAPTQVPQLYTAPQPKPSSSGPGRPGSTMPDLLPQYLPDGPKPGESEADFAARLTEEMGKMFAQIPDLSGTAPAQPQSPEDLAKMGKELETFTKKMEEQGIKPEDLLKAILGEEEGSKLAEMAHQERDRLDSLDQTRTTAETILKSPVPTEAQSSSGANKVRSATGTAKSAKSFEDTIRQTMSRLGESDTQATAATKQSQSTVSSEEAMLAEMLKSLGTGDGGDDSGMSKMFLDMMQQLTHKSMLYEPMKELNDQYPEWLKNNKPPKTKKDDYARFVKQQEIVREIVKKFEESGFSDENPECSEYIWNKMQQMQSQGAPPEDLVKNPFPGTDMGSIPGLGGGGPDEEGCPTQ